MLDIKLKLQAGHARERDWMAPSPLRQLCWNVTYACNYRCGICFTDSGTPASGELTPAEALEVVDKAHDAGVADIIISGGEPFVRPDLPEILKRMADCGMTARIASNGSCLTRDRLARLRAETLTKSFQISLDTTDPRLYAKFHGTAPDGFHQAMRALDMIQEMGFHTTISVRLAPATLPGIAALLDLAVAKGWSTVTIHCPVHTRRVHDAFPQDADILHIVEPALAHFASLPKRWGIETYIPWAEYHPVMADIAKRVRVLHRGCRAGRDRLTINPCGQLSPCVCMDVAVAYVGDVRRDDLAEVFRNAPVCNLMRRPWEHGVCAACPNVLHCGAGCRASAYAMTGRIDGQDKSCPVWQTRT